MKNRLLAALLLIGVLLSAAACATAQAAPDTNNPNNQVPPAPNKYIVTVGAEDFNQKANFIQQIEVKSGDIFTIALDSNATTGFQWTTQANITDLSVLRQTAHDYIAPATNDNDKPVAGMAGIEEWTFQAGDAGKTTVSLSYDRPWDGGEKGIRTFELTVIVK
jgi:inhibitor of cysteine peptidase